MIRTVAEAEALVLAGYQFAERASVAPGSIPAVVILLVKGTHEMTLHPLVVLTLASRNPTQ